jgi:large subunit ribosomal protein L6
MSRIGKRLINIPENVQVSIANQSINVKGPKGNLSRDIHYFVRVKQEDKNLKVDVKDKKDKFQRSLWGLYGSLIKNMITGVTKGFSKKLEINGVGYKANLSGKVLKLSLGYSHDIEYNIPQGIDVSVEKNIITVEGIDKELVGDTAAKIRSFRKPEPYKGRGIKYADEVIRRKIGKAAVKAG